MKSIAKLKDRARKHEQQEDWQAAIKAYRQVLEAQQGEDESELELGLFNRIGDLYLRVGQTDDAVSYYEQAADKYADAGFFNNAIALCNKALRHRPERPEIYLKLSRLSAEQGFTTDARRWILDYAERQVKLGKVDAALAGLSEFVDTSGDTDVREFLARQLATHGRPEEAVEHFVRAHQDRLARGETEAAERNADRARALDPSVDLEAAAGAVEAPAPDDALGGGEGLGGLDDSFGADLGEEEPEPLPGLETREDTMAGAEAGGGLEGLEGLEGFEQAGGAAAAEDEEVEAAELPGLELSGAEVDFGAPEEPAEAEAMEGLGGFETFDGLELGEEDEAEEPGAGVAPVAGGDGDEEDEEEPEPLPLMDIGLDEEAEAPDPLPLLDLDAEAEAEPEPEPEPVEAAAEEVESFDALDLGEAEEEVTEEAEEEEVELFGTLDFGEGEANAEPGGVEEPPQAAEPEEEEDEPWAAAETTREPWEPEEAGEPAESEEAGEAAEPWEVAGTDGGLDLDLNLDLGGFDGGPGAAASEQGASEARVDVEAVLTRARELVSRGLTSEALTELSLLPEDTGADIFGHALAVVNEIVRLDPRNLPALHRRVEYADRTGDQAVLVKASLDVANALSQTGAETKAEAMYQRVLDLDPGNEAALEALGSPAEPAGEEIVDLDAILRDIGPGEAAEAAKGPVPDPGADPEFAAMLSQFKAKVTDRGESEDAGDHYDLGLAFKEMGLVDEAIAEFQTALTGGEERLKVYEELGQCFVLKGQYNVALKVFNRALQVPHQDESELLGVYYHLGQCHEELGQREQARAAYEKVLGIDASFQDVPDRMARL